VNLVFLDANVLFSAAYRADAGLRRLWGLGETQLITSAYAVEEARRNLKLDEQRDRLEELLATVNVIAPLPGARPLPSHVQLPEKDRPILMAAIEAQATYLLTGDVKDFGAYYGQTIEGVMILPPAEYLRLYKTK